MSIFPYLLDESSVLQPSKILDQHFGMPLNIEDLKQAPSTDPSLLVRSYTGYYRTWRPAAALADCGSTVKFDENLFQAQLDVKQFQPEEITVKITGYNSVSVVGMHEMKQDKHSRVYRQFDRRYVLPRNCDMDTVKATLSWDGIVTITARRVKQKQKNDNVAITQTDKSGQTLKVKLVK